MLYDKVNRGERKRKTKLRQLNFYNYISNFEIIHSRFLGYFLIVNYSILDKLTFLPNLSLLANTPKTPCSSAIACPGVRVL